MPLCETRTSVFPFNKRYQVVVEIDDTGNRRVLHELRDPNDNLEERKIRVRRFFPPARPGTPPRVEEFDEDRPEDELLALGLTPRRDSHFAVSLFVMLEVLFLVLAISVAWASASPQ